LSKLIRVFLFDLWLTCLVVSGNPQPLVAQDARELQQEKVASKKLKGEHPLVEVMRTRKSALKPELANVHPRVYVTEKELDDLRVRAH